VAAKPALSSGSRDGSVFHCPGEKDMTRFQAAPRVAWTLALLALAGAPLAVSALAEDLGPAIGTTAPDIGTRLDQIGKPHRLPDLMGRNGLVLFFFRSAEWCSYCQAQLIDVNRGVAEIEKRGYHVAGLSYDSAEILQGFTVKRHLTYTLLSDPKSEVINRYNLRDPQYPPGSRAYGVPRPIIFILDPQAAIKAKLYEESFKNRPPVTAVISKLDELAGGS
jgi:peroxiredoxin